MFLAMASLYAYEYATSLIDLAISIPNNTIAVKSGNNTYVTRVLPKATSYIGIHGNQAGLCFNRYTILACKHKVLLLVSISAILPQNKSFRKTTKRSRRRHVYTNYPDKLENRRRGKFNREKCVST